MSTLLCLLFFITSSSIFLLFYLFSFLFSFFFFFFFFNDPAPTEIYTLSLHDALPIFPAHPDCAGGGRVIHEADDGHWRPRSEEHTSELQSRFDLVCRLLLEKKKKKKKKKKKIKK